MRINNMEDYDQNNDIDSTEPFLNEEVIVDDIYNDSVTNYTEVGSDGGVPVKQQLILVGSVLFLIFSTTLTSKFFINADSHNNQATDEVTESEIILNPINNEGRNFDDIALVGEAAYVWDINSQRVLYKKNEDEKLAIASITKLMTALLADEILAKKSGVQINSQALSQIGDSGLLLDEVFARETLSDLMLISSSNDGAYALAIAAGDMIKEDAGAGAFVKAMNVRAKELNLKDTTFYNPTGLDISKNQAGAYSTAKDMAFLMEYIVKNNPDILSLTREDSVQMYNESGDYHLANNTNYFVNQIPGLIGSKTGYTDLAGGNLVIAYDAGLNRPVVIVVLGSTQQDRFTDVMQLHEATSNYLINH